MSEEKLLAICIWLIVLASPFFFWLVLYIANPKSQEELRTQISRVKLLRWISYIAGVALGLLWVINQMPKNYWIFGSAVLTASLGLTFPTLWLKNRLAGVKAQTTSPPARITHVA